MEEGMKWGKEQCQTMTKMQRQQGPQAIARSLKKTATVFVNADSVYSSNLSEKQK